MLVECAAVIFDMRLSTCGIESALFERSGLDPSRISILSPEQDVRRIRDEVQSRADSVLDARKIQRDDVGEYTGKLLMRQRVVNERVIEWSGVVGEGTDVLDACAGPEGSFLAVTLRGGNWVGNEISERTAAHLRSTGARALTSSAVNFELENESFDLVAYIFAMNNIWATAETIKEARRVLRPHGHILVNDPGLTCWVVDLILYTLIQEPDCPEEIKDFFKNKKRFSEKIPAYYDRVSDISHLDYTKKVLTGLVGIDVPDALKGLIKIFSILSSYGDVRLLRKFERIFGETISAHYFGNVVKGGAENGLGVKKFGIMSTFRRGGSQEWESSQIVDLDVGEGSPIMVASTVFQVRNGIHVVSRDLVPKGQEISQNIVTPVLLLGS